MARLVPMPPAGYRAAPFLDGRGLAHAAGKGACEFVLNVDVLRLVRKELECKEPHVSPRPAAHAAAPLRLTLGCRNRPATCL